MKQVLFVLMALLGLIMLVWGIRKLLQVFRRKTILVSNLMDGKTTFRVEKTGNYSFCFLGGWKISNTSGVYVTITNSRGERVSLFRPITPYRSRYQSKKLIEYCYFQIGEIEEYTLELKGINDLSLKSAMHPMVTIFQSKLPSDKVQFIIQESASKTWMILGIVSLVLGLNIFAWGLVLSFNPNFG